MELKGDGLAIYIVLAELGKNGINAVTIAERMAISKTYLTTLQRRDSITPRMREAFEKATGLNSDIWLEKTVKKMSYADLESRIADLEDENAALNNKVARLEGERDALRFAVGEVRAAIAGKK